MGLIEERNSWKLLFEQGYIPVMIKDNKPITDGDLIHYSQIRGSELNRMSRVWEQACEYLLWKQEKLSEQN